MANAERIVWMDGAMGTELLRAGICAESCLPAVALDRPNLVAAIHRAYADAGAEIVLTNSFTLNPPALRRWGRECDGPKIGRAAVALAKPFGLTLASIGPIGGEGIDVPDESDLMRTLEWLGDADGVLLETMSDASAMRAAAAVRRERPDLPAHLSFAFRRDADGILRTRSGLAPETIAEQADRLGLAALGVNCGVDLSIADLAEIVRTYRSRARLPLMARPNAGTPTCDGLAWSWPWGPETMARAIPSLIAAGATLIGGCCGTTPAHLRAMREASDPQKPADSGGPFPQADAET